MSIADVLIAGAGIGGLTAALALHERGIAVTVLEAASTVRPLGVGINIQPAAIAELTGLGLGPALAATGIATREHRYVDHRGTVHWTEPRGIAAGHAAPQYSVHRGELQTMLVAAVRDRIGPDAVRTGARVHAMEYARAGVRVRTEGAGVFHGAALVGADGVHSVVRSHLHPDGMALSGGEVGMWRGLCEWEAFLDGRTMIVANDDHAARMVAYPVSARHLARRRALLNWVCLVPAAGLRSGDPAGPARPDDVLAHIGHWHLDWLDVERMIRSSPEILHYPMVDRDPLPWWGDGRSTLLGDAAHLMFPIGANGASQAIIDAAVLADQLSRHPDVRSGLEGYERIRRPATTAVVLAGRDMDRAERTAAVGTGVDRAAELSSAAGRYRTTVEASHSPGAG